MCEKDLVKVLSTLPNPDDPKLLVGKDSFADAGVYSIGNNKAIIQTVDFFTPIVDDPYKFGQIAASNALSDIYAMGGVPLTALNIVGFPKDLDISILSEILKGGYDKLREAKTTLIGGHTIQDKEIKYGLTVTGIIERDKIITNKNAKPGDLLILTKPIGTGIISTALKADMVDEKILNSAINSMVKLNNISSAIMVEVGADACVDITGFGLLGHLHQMAYQSGVSVRIYNKKVPKFDGIYKYIKMGLVPAGTYKNLEYISQYVNFGPSVSEEDKILLADAQTSGGLLISIDYEKVPHFLEKMEKANEPAFIIGEVIQPSKYIIEIE